ncbi:MAG: helix-turn-helix domain-containing protein [Clostridia bacterium]|nr:helix-turn-helix domain-containing protein [Clostridia bacterium]MBR2288522.1 helix-turn-helix domain-containing protein [Clostridia bacterium]
MCDVLDRVEKMGADKKEKALRESFAKKMLAAGKSQDEVAEFSGLSKTTIAKLAKVIAVAAL